MCSTSSDATRTNSSTLTPALVSVDRDSRNWTESTVSDALRTVGGMLTTTTASATGERLWPSETTSTSANEAENNANDFVSV